MPNESNDETNALGQPIGAALPGWRPPEAPARASLAGHHCRLEPLDVDVHTEALFAANSLDHSGSSWTYMAYGPFADLSSYRMWAASFCCGDDPLFYAILAGDDAPGPTGVASYRRIRRDIGCIEIAHVHLSPTLQRSAAATEALYLLVANAFQLGYRRCEWKCDALNSPSRRAAQRLGFSFEGVFRQEQIYKARNRDTAWYAIIDREWPRLCRTIEHWLEPRNFDEQGRQIQSLSKLTRPFLERQG